MDYKGFEITKLGEKTGWWAIYAIGSFKTTKQAKNAIDKLWESIIQGGYDPTGKPKPEPSHRRVDIGEDEDVD